MCELPASPWNTRRELYCRPTSTLPTDSSGPSADGALPAEAERRRSNCSRCRLPVAGELREVLTGLQIVADIDRMYALALHVAKVARLPSGPGTAARGGPRLFLPEMGRLAVRLADGAREVLQTSTRRLRWNSTPTTTRWTTRNRHLFSVLMDREWPHGVAAAVDVTLLGRYHERFADHAVAVGRVVFQAGQDAPSSSPRGRGVSS